MIFLFYLCIMIKDVLLKLSNGDNNFECDFHGEKRKCKILTLDLWGLDEGKGITRVRLEEPIKIMESREIDRDLCWGLDRDDDHQQKKWRLIVMKLICILDTEIKKLDMKIIEREDLTTDIYLEVLEKEGHHDHLIKEDINGKPRWVEDEIVSQWVDEKGLNDVINILYSLGYDKNSEPYRKLYRDIGYSLYGYWEIFYWEVNNELSNEYNPDEGKLEWKDINVVKPTKEDCGIDFLVAVKLSSRHEYQVAEWFDAEDGETEPYFNIENGWCGQQMLKKEVTHWMEIKELPN